jgi:anti-sigma factor RsiW
MNCSDLETLLCDYVDGTLEPGRKAAVERHLAQCPACAEMAGDSAAAVAFMERAAEVEPPPELVNRILFDLADKRERTPERRRGVLAALKHLLGPVLQPRFAMGMAMTILSFSMLARFAGINVRQLSVADLDPVKVWQAVDERVYRGYKRVAKFYEGLRFVYEIRSRLAELAVEEDETAAQTTQGTQKK